MKFEKRIVFNDVVWKTFYKLFYFKNKDFRDLVILSIFYVIILMIDFFLQAFQSKLLLIVLGGFLGIMFSLFFLFYSLTLNRVFKIQRELGISEQELVYRFYDKYVQILNKQTKAQIKMKYSVFTIIIQSKKYLLISSKEKQILMIGKNQFEENEYQEFVNFINEKCLALKKKLK